MNSARHANRSRRPEQSERGRGRGRGGRPRGGFGDSERGSVSYGPVPTIRQVVVGAPVSIILKVDQPTGHQVQGIVDELLTRGDHPRGIKVRLQDGRVGRVQKMVSIEEAQAASAGLSGLDRNGETSSQQTSAGTSGAGILNSFSRSRYSDFRTDGGEEPEREEISLADYVVKDNRSKKGVKASRVANCGSEDGQPESSLEVTGTVSPSKTVECPVCGEFEGDEIAVAHHVDTHFT